jgi:hypothetical protein
MQNIKPTANGIIVGLPETSHMQAQLPLAARKAHIFPNMQAALLSIPKICDAGYHPLFSQTDVNIMDRNGTIVLSGRRDPLTKLWHVPIHHHAAGLPTLQSTNTMHFTNSAYHQKTKEDLITFLHAAAGYPPSSHGARPSTLGSSPPGQDEPAHRSANTSPNPYPPSWAICTNNNKA